MAGITLLILTACGETSSGNYPSATDSKNLSQIVSRGDISVNTRITGTHGEITGSVDNSVLTKLAGLQNTGTWTKVPVKHQFRVKPSPELEALKASGLPLYVYTKPKVRWVRTEGGRRKSDLTPVSDNGYSSNTTCTVWENTGGIMFVLLPQNNYKLDLDARYEVPLIRKFQNGSTLKTISVDSAKGEIRRVGLSPFFPRSDTCYHKKFAGYRS